MPDIRAVLRRSDFSSFHREAALTKGAIPNPEKVPNRLSASTTAVYPISLMQGIASTVPRDFALVVWEFGFGWRRFGDRD
jgi:hypothetical protein